MLKDQLESPIKADEPESTKNAKRYYLSCMDEGRNRYTPGPGGCVLLAKFFSFQAKIERDGEAQFLNMLNTEFDGWPIISLSYVPKDPTAKLIDYFKRNVRPILSIGVTSNPKVPDEYVLGVSQPGWYFSKQYYNDGNFTKAYEQYIYKVAEFMGAPPSGYQAEAKQMMDLETKFGKVSHLTG